MGFLEKIFKKDSEPGMSITPDEKKPGNSPDDTPEADGVSTPEASVEPERDAEKAIAVTSTEEVTTTTDSLDDTATPPADMKVETTPSPLAGELNRLRGIVAELSELKQTAEADYRRLEEVGTAIEAGERSHLDYLQQTRAILGEIADVLSGRDTEKTLDEINDLLAAEIGLVENGGEEPVTDTETLLTLVRDKSRGIQQEIGIFVEQSRNSLIHLQDQKHRQEARLTVLERKLEEATELQAQATEVLQGFLNARRSLERDVDSTEASRKNIETQISLLEEKIQQVIREKEHLEEQGLEAEEVNRKLNERLEVLRSETADAESTIDELQRALKILQEEHEQVQQNLRAAQKETENIQGDIEVAEKTRDDHHRMEETLESEIARIKTDIATLSGELADVQRSRENLTATRQSHEESHAELADRAEELQATLAGLVEEKSVLEETVESEKAALQEMEQQLMQWHESAAASDEDHQMLQDEINRVADEVAQLKARIGDVTSQRQDLGHQLDAAKSAQEPGAELDDLRTVLQQAEEERETLGQQLDELLADIHSAEVATRENTEAMAVVVKERQELEDRLKEENNRLEELRHRVAEAGKAAAVGAEDRDRARKLQVEEEASLRRTREKLDDVEEERSALEEELARVDRPVAATPSPTPAPAGEIHLPEAAGEDATGDESPDHRKAQRLARVIVSDLILYNKEILKTAANQRNFAELLENPIKRSRDYFREKVPAAVIKERDYLQEEIEKLRLSLKP